MIVALYVVGCGKKETEKQTTQSELITEKFVTLDEHDTSSNITVKNINLWKNYKDRAAGIVATVNHGDSVKLIKREGDGILVETRDGKRG